MPVGLAWGSVVGDPPIGGALLVKPPVLYKFEIEFIIPDVPIWTTEELFIAPIESLWMVIVWVTLRAIKPHHP